MIKRILAIVILLATYCNIIFADVQPGYVRTIKRPGKKAEYLDNVQISVKGISGSFKSMGKGKFELELRPLNLKVGNQFALSSVYKSGYELYDNNLTRVYSPGAPIEIVLKNIAQEAADQQKFADNMYKGAISQRDKKIKELDKQLEEGKISQEKYREQLQQYNDVFDKYQADINTIAKRYAGLDYENIDPVTEAINVAFSNGDFVLADSLLNTLGSIEAEINANIAARSDIDAKIDFGNAIVEEGNNERTQNLQDAERLAELAYAKHLSFLNNFQNDSAAYYLEKRTELLPQNIDYQLEAGGFQKDYMAQYQEALEYYNKALTLALDQYGENHPDVATSYNSIGLVYASQGNYDRALEFYERALKIYLEIFGENHQDVATSYNNIGFVYASHGNYEKALKFYEKALKISLGIFGENHPDVAMSYNNIGTVYSSQGNYGKALEFYEKALKIYLEIFGENHPYVAKSYNNIGSVYDSLGYYDRALEFHEKSLKIQLGIFGENHPDVAMSYNNIGSVYGNQGNYDRALEIFEESLNIILEIFGENHPDVAMSYNNIGFVYDGQGNYGKALEFYEKALKIRLGIFGENHPDVATSYNNIGSVYDSLGYYDRALEFYEKALKIYLEIFGENHPDVATSYNNIGFVYDSLGYYEKALEFYEKALKIDLEIFGENHPNVEVLYANIYDVYFKLQESDEFKNKEFDQYISDKVWVGTIVGDDSPAAKLGLNGEYVIFKYGNWGIGNPINIIAENKGLKGKPKDVVLYKDGKILQHHFEDQIGIYLEIKVVGSEKKKQIEDAYKKWMNN